MEQVIGVTGVESNHNYFYGKDPLRVKNVERSNYSEPLIKSLNSLKTSNLRKWRVGGYINRIFKIKDLKNEEAH